MRIDVFEMLRPVTRDKRRDKRAATEVSRLGTLSTSDTERFHEGPLRYVIRDDAVGIDQAEMKAGIEEMQFFRGVREAPLAPPIPTRG